MNCANSCFFCSKDHRLKRRTIAPPTSLPRHPPILGTSHSNLSQIIERNRRQIGADQPPLPPGARLLSLTPGCISILIEERTNESGLNVAERIFAKKFDRRGIIFQQLPHQPHEPELVSAKVYS